MINEPNITRDSWRHASFRSRQRAPPGDSHLELVPPTCTSAVLEGLDTGQLYQFRVYAENAAGMSDALLGPRSVRIQPCIGNYIRLPYVLFFLTVPHQSGAVARPTL